MTRPGTGPEEMCQIWNCKNYAQHYYFLSWERGGLEQRCRYHFQIAAANRRERGIGDLDVFELTWAESVVWRTMNE